MSDAHGAVIGNGRILGYFWYAGVVNMAQPTIYPTLAEAVRLWRQGPSGWDRIGACHHEPLTAVLYSTYGSGSYWPTRVCMECMVILSEYDDVDETWEFGPGWVSLALGRGEPPGYDALERPTEPE